MKQWRSVLPLGAALFAWGSLHAQTSIDLRRQGRNVDFSSATSTKPSKTGTVLPAACAVGETFFKTDAPAGGNLHLCGSTNVWTQVSGSASSSSIDFYGGGAKVLTTDGGLPENAVTSIDATGKSVDSGCTVSGGVMNCPNGLTSGTGTSQVTMTEGAGPANAPGGKQILYIDETDHRPKFVDAMGVVRAIGATAGALTAGAVATFDAAGRATASGCSIAAGALNCVLPIPSWNEFPAAICQEGAAYLGFNALSGSAPSAICVTGANTVYGVASFTDPGQIAQLRFILPDDWSPGAGNDLELRFRSSSAGGAGSVAWNVQTACAAGGFDPAFGPAQLAGVSAQANGAPNMASIQGFTIPGCSGGSLVFLRVALDGSTTAAGDQELLSLRVRLKRAVAAL
jgi:hypothetical protein